MCQPQSKELGVWVSKTWSKLWGLLGQGIRDLDLGLTIKQRRLNMELTYTKKLNTMGFISQKYLVYMVVVGWMLY